MSGCHHDRHRRGGARWGDPPPAPVATASGFTLVELLVVIAVMAVLAGLLLPVLARAREEGRRVACLSNLRQISQAHLMYVQDWDERLVPWYVPGLPPP